MGPSNKFLPLTNATAGVRLLDVREESHQRPIVAMVLQAYGSRRTRGARRTAPSAPRLPHQSIHSPGTGSPRRISDSVSACGLRPEAHQELSEALAGNW